MSSICTSLVIQADSRQLPIADDSVDLVITSPPYFGLRSYKDGGEHYEGQIGDEPTPEQFICSLVEVTRECVRTLKPSGSLWVNLGDTYRNRGLLGMPWRYALACIAEEGLNLTLRAEVIWAKSDGLPSSATDRVRRTHEQWFHFTLSDETYSNLDEIRSPYEGEPQRRLSSRIKDRTAEGRPVGEWSPVWAEQISGENQLGKVPGSVWGAATSKFVAPDHLNVPHFAAFPTYFPDRIIRGWSPAGGVVLDPFGGTGTTALVAKALGRHGISVDMSADYCRLAEWRTNDPKQLAKAARKQFTASPQPLRGQMDLLEEIA